MSNSLEDHMAELLLRAIVRFPDRCPPALVGTARWYWDARNQYLYGPAHQTKYIHEYVLSKGAYYQRLEEFSHVLPEILKNLESENE